MLDLVKKMVFASIGLALKTKDEVEDYEVEIISLIRPHLIMSAGLDCSGLTVGMLRTDGRWRLSCVVTGIRRSQQIGPAGLRLCMIWMERISTS